MAQRSVLTRALQSREHKPLLTYRWMRYFFTEDTSPDHRPIAELQQRAAWIALAILLQSADQVPWFTALSAFIPFFLILASFAALWMALRPTPASKNDTSITEHKAIRSKLWQRAILIITLIVTIGGAVQCAYTVWECLGPPNFSNDGTALDANAALLLIEGQNPYTDSNFYRLVHTFHILPNQTTPLRVGQFVDRLDYPTDTELLSILDTSLRTGNVPELEAKVSYPALSFLTLMPFVLIQNYNVLPFYLISYIVIVAIAWKTVRRELRPWVLLLAIANVPMWASTMGGNLDIFYTLLLIVAWLKRDMRWMSAVFFGLALTTKQLAWYFIPFYAIMVLRNYGLKESFYRLAIAGGLALAINLPFIMWDYHTFLAGVLAPIADPMFPMGVGLVGLSTAHLIPYLPTWVYSGLEYMAWLGTSIWYWRICRQRPEAAILFAVMPIFLAWRSLSSYFYCVAYPIFILFSAQRKPVTQHAFSFLRNSKSATASGRISSPISI